MLSNRGEGWCWGGVKGDGRTGLFIFVENEEGQLVFIDLSFFPSIVPCLSRLDATRMSGAQEIPDRC